MGKICYERESERAEGNVTREGVGGGGGNFFKRGLRISSSSLNTGINYCSKIDYRKN